MSTTVDTGVDVRPFHIEIADEQLANLRRRKSVTHRKTPDCHSTARHSTCIVELLCCLIRGELR